ncbi:hypothetical protein [Amphritea balenae]|nr:hypothetical protein [Amphritea balenae]GGK65956.1 hypothetical protein GCM10007941_15220 [Amphritea balenae]
MFEDMTESSSFLEDKGLGKYDMNKEENTSHLIYGAGRNRVY